MTHTSRPPLTAIAFPLLAIAFVFAAPYIGYDPSAQPPSTYSLVVSGAMIVIMLGAVFAAVFHADVIAHRVGEPYGTLVLTLAVTIIEVALIESIVLTPGSSPALARDTVFAVVMIVCNGLIGLCIIWGGLRHHEQEYQTSGAGVYLTVLGALSVLTLVLYAAFLFIQTSRHTEYFRADVGDASDPDHGLPSSRLVLISVIMLLVALTGVILTAKKFAIILEAGLTHFGAPPAVAGIIIAMVVLAPESITAVRAAERNELQKSLNLALGSSLATIGLTIPAVAITNVFIGKQIEIGLSGRDTLLLALTLFLSLLTFGTGRTNILSGLVHLVVFATFLFLVFVP
jgi:Ca2+:H+ antiporter